MQKHTKLIKELWTRAMNQVMNPTGHSDFPRDYNHDDIMIVFAQLVAQQCLTHVDKWTGTKFTPATDTIKQDIQQDFDC